MPEESRSLSFKVDELVRSVEELRAKAEEQVEGNGLIVLHNTRIDVDASVRITDLLKKIRSLEDRVLYLESVVGSETETPTASVPEFRLGNWQFTVSSDGNTLYKQADINRGLTTAQNWETREENTI